MPMSSAMWRRRSLSGSPRSPRRVGMAPPAWSAVRKKSDLPSSATMTGGGSPSESRRIPATGLIDLGVAGAGFGLGQSLNDLQLGPLEAQIDVEEPVAEPLARLGASLQPVERLGERPRQRADAGGDALGLAHVREIALGHRRQRAVVADAVDP